MCVYLHTRPSKESLEVKLPTIWIDEAAEVGRGREEKKSEEKESAERRSRCTKRSKSRQRGVFFQCFVALEGRKVVSIKRRVQSHIGETRNQKLHAAAARSTYRSQNVQSTTCSDHFSMFRCRKKHWDAGIWPPKMWTLNLLFLACTMRGH